jgi:hypothetical protein
MDSIIPVNNSVPPNNNLATTKIEKIKSLIIFFFKTLIFVSMISYTILEINNAIVYQHSECSASMYLTVPNWLFMHGSIGIILIMTYQFLNIFYSKQISSLFLKFAILFNFCWIIVGSILFWADCSNIEPKIFNDFVKVTIILNYFVLIINVCNINKFDLFDMLLDMALIYLFINE